MLYNYNENEKIEVMGQDLLDPRINNQNFVKSPKFFVSEKIRPPKAHTFPRHDNEHDRFFFGSEALEI